VRLGERGPHLPFVGDISANEEHFCSQGLDFSDLADFAANVLVVRLVRLRADRTLRT